MKTGTLTSSSIEIGSSNVKIENVDGYLKFTDGYYSTGTTFSTLGSTSLGWQTAYDVNFGSLTPQTFSSDTTYTIDGKTWNILNKVRANTFDITSDGIGGTSDGGGIGGGSWLKTAPMAYIQLTQLIPDLDANYGIRVWIYVSVNNLSNSWESIYLNIGAPVANLFDKHHWILKYGGGIEIGGTINAAGAGPIGAQQTNSPADDVLVLELDKLNEKFHRGYSGVYASDYPAITTWRARPEITISTAASSAQTSMISPADVYLYLIAQPSDTVTSLIGELKECAYSTGNTKDYNENWNISSVNNRISKFIY